MNSFPIPAESIVQEYAKQKQSLAAQPVMVQRFLEAQAKLIAEALIKKSNLTKVNLPDKVLVFMKNFDTPVEVALPSDARVLKLGGVMAILNRLSLQHEINHKFAELEQSPDIALSTTGSLLRFATANHLIYNMLPAGKTVEYIPAADEAIPTVPVSDGTPESAITQQGDAIVEGEGSRDERGELQTPFVPSARVFFLPQWVSFDKNGALISESANKADADLRSMQNYVNILHRASSIAPYMVADSEYQRKRYGILGQLINQGRAIASFRVNQIINHVKERVASNSLNRGLSLSIPYFDDQSLKMDKCDFEVIPAGRIMFVPAFVIQACRGEMAKREQDTRLNRSTRNALLHSLNVIITAFEQPNLKK